MNNATQAEYYGNVWKIGADSNIPTVASTANNAGVNWDKADTTSAVPTGAEVITYSGLTLVPDDTEVLKNQGISSPSQAQMTDVYQWGYADVRVNGTAYGAAINPYASAASAVSGGDGFDISWAVDENGVPVPLTSVRYVRVYSAVLFNAGIFGETSAEVCGLYKVNGNGGSAATSDLVIYDATYNPLSDVNNVAEKTITVSANTDATYYIYSTEEHVFLNGEDISATSATMYPLTVNLASGSKSYQIITQSGTEEPFVTVLKFVVQ